MMPSRMVLANGRSKRPSIAAACAGSSSASQSVRRCSALSEAATCGPAAKRAASTATCRSAYPGAEVGYRRGQAQSEAGPWLGAACLQPHESLHRVLAIGGRNSWAVIGDAEQHLVALAPHLDQDLLGIHADDCALRLRRWRRLAVFDGIFDQVRQRLTDQFAIAVDRHRRSLDAQAHAVVLGERLIEFMNAVGDLGGVE